MTTFSNRFVVAMDFGTTATRESGALARERVLRVLANHAQVVLDFSNASFVTPSFADELVGRLAEALGEAEFRRRVELTNVDQQIRPLIRQVLVGRLRGAKSSPKQGAVCHA
jgi:hypothetical protein